MELNKVDEYHVEMLRDVLNRLRAGLTFLEEIASKRVRLNHDGGHAAGGSAPFPLNVTACDLIDAIRAAAADIAQHIGLRFGPSMDAAGLLKGLCRYWCRCMIATIDDGLYWISVMERLNELQRQADRLIDPHEPQRYIGVCPTCRAGLWVPDGTTLKPDEYRLCFACHKSYRVKDVQQAQLARLLLANVVDTDDGIRRTLHSCGLTVGPCTLRLWKTRGVISDLGQDESGRNLYSLSEVLCRLHQTKYPNLLADLT